MRAILRILRLVIDHYKARLVVGYIAVFGAAASSLAVPRILGTSVNRVLESGDQDISRFYMLALALLAAGVARGLFAFGQTYIAESTSQKVAYDLRNDYFYRLQHLGFAFHDQQMTGGLMSRATADVEGVRMFINIGAIRAGFIFATILGIAIVTFMMDVKLALVGLSFVPFLAWRAIVSSWVLRRAWMRVQELMGEMTTVLQENLSGIRVTKALAGEDYEKKKFREAAARVAEQRFRAEKNWALNFSSMNFGFIVAIGAILWVGGQDVANGRMLVDGEVVYTGLTPGDLTAFIFYMGLLTMPVRMLGWMVNSFSRAASCGERIFEILDTESPVEDKVGAITLPRVRGRVAFENVSFRYDGGPEVLRDINIQVEPGQTVALLGRPGSGKSTFVHLLPRFYDVTEGRVTIDGIDVRDVTLTSLRNNVGLVQQDIFIHSASIQENITWGSVDSPFEQVREVAVAAQMHDFIDDFPDGYATIVGERGVGLSGGQKQRLSLGRTLLRDCPILVMDDSTSSVDAQTERLIQEALLKAAENRTTFIIAHRLSSIQHADLILVFKDGSIVERGTHRELMAKGGEYRELYDLQLRPQELGDAGQLGDSSARPG